MSKWNIPEKGHMDKTDGLYLQNMTAKDVRKRLKENDLIIVPLGSTEAHGDSAPLGEDTILVTRMAEQVAQKTGCTIAMPIWYGSHPYHHLGMPGTIPVPENIFIANIVSVITGLWNSGFRKQILLNGHGQEYVIPNAIHMFAKKYQVPAVLLALNWYHAVPNEFKTKEDGGPYETKFIHADEQEQSWTLALLPEMCKMEDACDNVPYGYLKEGHIDKAGNIGRLPIHWYGQVGAGPIEVSAYPEGCVGRPTLASAEKAKPGVEKFLDYLEKLVKDIIAAFPPGKLPPTEEVTQRPKEEIDKLLKGPLAEGGKSIYTLGWPPA